MSRRNSTFLLLLFILLTLTCCEKPDYINISCEIESEVLYEFESPDGFYLRIYENGEAYFVKRNGCEFAETIFSPTFFQDSYVATDSGILIKVDEATFIEPIRSFQEDFETGPQLLDYIRTDLTQTDRVFTAFTAQSPAFPEVEDYVALRQCIIDKECDFEENRISIVKDPIDENNQVLKFEALAPSTDMVTSKSSISSGLLFFEKSNDFWFEASYFIEKGLPTTIADFESSHFKGHPGPRLIFRNGALSVENKFGDKKEFFQDESTLVKFPLMEWVKVKVNLMYHENEGIIRVWQNDELIIDAAGQNIPHRLWIQNSLEIGISATQEDATMYLDDLRFSNEAF